MAIHSMLYARDVSRTIVVVGSEAALIPSVGLSLVYRTRCSLPTDDRASRRWILVPAVYIRRTCVHSRGLSVPLFRSSWIRIHECIGATRVHTGTHARGARVEEGGEGGGGQCADREVSAQRDREKEQVASRSNTRSAHRSSVHLRAC